MADAVKISKDIDAKIYAMARDYYRDVKKGGQDTASEIKAMVSGQLDDGNASSLLVRIMPNPINPRLAAGWKVSADQKVWEIPTSELEKSRLL